MNKYSQIVFLTPFFIMGVMSACNSATENASTNNKSTDGSNQQKSTTAGNKQENTKSTNGKTSEEPTQTKLIEIYDGRRAGETTELPLSKAERESVEKAVKAKEVEIRKISTECEKDEFSVGGGIKGSFTKPNSSETAYFYSFCTNGSVTSPVEIGGIIIFEADTPTALYAFQTIGSNDINILPDINKNGLSEFVLITEDGGQGMRATQMTILEYQAGDSLKYIGSTKVGSVSFSTTPIMETTTVISVEPSTKPVFFYDLYVKEDGAKNWSLSGKSEKFALMPEGKGSTAFIKVN